MAGDTDSKTAPSRRYQDYVIREGKLVGEFEAMYQNAAEVPWHQDKTAYALFCEFDLAILRHFFPTGQWRSVLDVGCGLGYLTSRLKTLFPEADVRGVDVSITAITKARTLHPGITFDVADLRKPDCLGSGPYDLVFVKDLLWYVLPELATVIANLETLLRGGGFIYISQAVPGLPDYYGKEVFPDPTAILDYFARSFELQYASSTHEKNTARVNGVYDIDHYARFLGKKI